MMKSFSEDPTKPTHTIPYASVKPFIADHSVRVEEV
jgi:hypothetical protein